MGWLYEARLYMDQRVSLATLPYTRSLPEIFGRRYLYERESLLAGDQVELSQFVAQDFQGTLLFGQDEVINFFPSTSIEAFNVLVDGNEEIRLSETLNMTESSDTDNDELIIPLMRPGVDIYGHWLLDLLPKVALLEKYNPGANYTVLVDEKCPDWALTLIAETATNTMVIKKITTGEMVSGRFFLTSPIRRHDFISEMCRIDTFVPRQTERGTRKVYLSRKHLNSHYRELENSARIERIFKAKGFELIYPEELSITQQIALFSDTAILAGEAGSSLHNSIFCPPNVVVINLQSGRQNHFIQAGLCHWYHQDILYVFGKTETSDWDTNFKIRGRDCRAAIKRAEAIIATL